MITVEKLKELTPQIEYLLLKRYKQAKGEECAKEAIMHGLYKKAKIWEIKIKTVKVLGFNENPEYINILINDAEKSFEDLNWILGKLEENKGAAA